jgi:hypothetical protein
LEALFIELSKNVAATRPFSALCGFIVVKLGALLDASEMPSKPVIWTSRGTLRPSSLATLIADNAITSLMHRGICVNFSFLAIMVDAHTVYLSGFIQLIIKSILCSTGG